MSEQSEDQRQGLVWHPELDGDPLEDKGLEKMDELARSGDEAFVDDVSDEVVSKRAEEASLRQYVKGNEQISKVLQIIADRKKKKTA